jgi:hypothetical protein
MLAHNNDIYTIHKYLMEWASDNGYSDMIDELIGRINPYLVVKLPEREHVWQGQILVNVKFDAATPSAKQMLHDIAADLDNRSPGMTVDFDTVDCVALEYKQPDDDVWLQA